MRVGWKEADGFQKAWIVFTIFAIICFVIVTLGGAGR